MDEKLDMVVHAYNISTQEVETGDCHKSKASLFYLVNSRPARATYCLKKKKKKKKTAVVER